MAAARLGVPPPFLRYIRELYSNAVTTLRIGKNVSAPIRLGRGIRQGDPLSVHLFNAVIDMCLGGLDPSLGYEVGDLNISSGPRGKCASVRLDIDSKAKKWVINPLPYLRVVGEIVPAVLVSQVYRYLGVDVSPCHTRANVASMLRDGFASISSAPLKPQHRLYIATYHLLPKCHHQLALPPSSAKYLRWLDWTVRSALRSWLKLPRDAPVDEGGVGVPLHEHVVPLMRAKHLSRLDETPDPVTAAMLKVVSASAGSATMTCQTTLNGRVMTSSRDLKTTLATMLHRTVDGRGLVHSSRVPECHRWVNPVMSGGTPKIAGSYISAITVRGNMIGTALRSSRDCCGRTKSLAHLSQVCLRTHASRIAWHGKIIDLVEQALTPKGYTTCREPAIPTLAGIRKPDLVVSRGSAVTVLNITVVANNADLALSHGRKCEYYDTPAVCEWVRER